MFSMMDLDLARQRREELLREARLQRLAQPARPERRRGLRAAVAWELRRYGGRLRKRLRRR